MINYYERKQFGTQVIRWILYFESLDNRIKCQQANCSTTNLEFDSHNLSSYSILFDFEMHIVR